MVAAAFHAEGQNLSRIDSLKKLLPGKSGVDKFDLLNDIGFEYRLSLPDSTIYFCSLAYELGKQLDLKKDLSRPLSFIGLANAYKGQYKTSFEFHTQAIEVAQQQNDSLQLAYSYNNFGRLFFDQGDLERAYDNLVNSQRLFEKLKDPTGLAYVYRSLTDLHKSQEDYPKALAMAEKAYQLRNEAGEPRGLLSSLMEMGSVFSAMNNPGKADRCFEKADSIATRIEDIISHAEIQIGWGEFLLSILDTTRAHNLAHEAYDIISKAGNQRLLPRATLLMGRVHYAVHGHDAAKLYFERVINSTEETHLDLQRDAYYFLSKIFEKEGKQIEATRAFNKFLILKESLQSIELARQIEKLQFQLEIEKIERENESLKTNEARNDAIIRQQQLENVILIVVVTFISAMFIMQWRNAVKRSDASTKLAYQNQEIEKQRTEIAEKNEKLEKRNRELSELNYEKDTLMNIVAHDLKSPLNRIKGLSDLIEMEDALNPNQLKYLELIKDSTRGGLDLIGDLLDVNALEANREPEYSFFNLAAFLTERINAFRPGATAKSIDLISGCSYNGLVYLDQLYLTRIMDNLISNAIKFSPRGSTVQVMVEQRNGHYAIQVKDQGPGFSEEDKQYLFQKFKKLSARPTGGESSNGLGLAIVKILVERLGGTITLHTDTTGSTFEVQFPVTDTIQV
jgi:signal transduction histidine kinase